MRLRVVRTHRRGIPLSRRELSQSRGVLGQLLTESTTDERYKGVIVVARLQDDTAAGKPLNDVLPRLYAPVLQILSIQGLLLSGHERIDEDGQVHDYVQGWWARIP
jgi:hypothetical protein